MAPSVSRGRLAVMLGWLRRLRPLLAARGHLYVSSANRTGGEVAVTAAAADAALGGRLLVLDGDAERGPLGQPGSSGSAAIVAVGPGRRLELLRHGVNDASFSGDDAAFLDALERRWATHRPRNGPAPTGG